MKLTILSIGLIIIILTANLLAIMSINNIEYNHFYACVFISIGVALSLISLVIKGKWL